MNEHELVIQDDDRKWRLPGDVLLSVILTPAIPIDVFNLFHEQTKASLLLKYSIKLS